MDTSIHFNKKLTYHKLSRYKKQTGLLIYKKVSIWETL